jgi:putative OPT family oligopeptide transporter
LVSALVVLSLVFVFTSVSSYTVGLVGNSNNPSSALAVCAFLIASLLFFTFGMAGGRSVTAGVLLISAFVCTASATAGDTAQHLKTGAILRGTPRRQEIAQLLGVTAFAFIVAPIVVLLVKGYGLGSERPDALKAPQAALFANLADMVFGDGGLPRTMLWIGAACAVATIGIDALLRRTGSPVRLSVMPVAIGMYLPVSLTAPMLLGALLPVALRRLTRSHGEHARDAALDRSTLLWSGLITGEALIGVSVAVPRWLGFDVPVRIVDAPAVSLAAFGLVIGSILYLSTPADVRQTWRRRADVHHDGRG